MVNSAICSPCSPVFVIIVVTMTGVSIS